MESCTVGATASSVRLSARVLALVVPGAFAAILLLLCFGGEPFAAGAFFFFLPPLLARLGDASGLLDAPPFGVMTRRGALLCFAVLWWCAVVCCFVHNAREGGSERQRETERESETQ